MKIFLLVIKIKWVALNNLFVMLVGQNVSNKTLINGFYVFIYKSNI